MSEAGWHIVQGSRSVQDGGGRASGGGASVLALVGGVGWGGRSIAKDGGWVGARAWGRAECGAAHVAGH